MAGVGSVGDTVASATKRGGDGNVMGRVHSENAKDKKKALSHLTNKPAEAPAVPANMHHYGKRHGK